MNNLNRITNLRNPLKPLLVLCGVIKRLFERRIEGYIIETEILNSIDKNKHVSWYKWNRKVYKDLPTAIEAWNNLPKCYKNLEGWFNVKCRIIPVYRGKVECELSADGNVL